MRVAAVREALVGDGVAPEAVDAALDRLDALRLTWVDGAFAIALPVEADITAAHLEERWTEAGPALRC